MPADLDDPIERGLLDLADEAMDGGADVEDVGDWLRREIENYREQQAETQTEVEADITTDTVGVTDEEAQRRCSTGTICFMPISEDVDREEFRRQLKLQERALNGMTPGEMLANRAAYLANPVGMRRLSDPLQARTRDEYESSIESDFLRRYGLIEGPIKLAEHMDTVAALHNPDMIAGGLYASVAGPSIPLADRSGGSTRTAQWDHNGVEVALSGWQITRGDKQPTAALRCR